MQMVHIYEAIPLFLFDFVSSLAAREKCSFLLEKENCIATQW